MNILTSVALGWLGRRFQELGSLAAVVIPIYLAMPKQHQDEILMIVTGRGGNLSISAAIGLVWYLWTQWQSYRATVKPQIVTKAGEKIEGLPDSVQATVEATAGAAPRRRTIANVILDALSKKR